MKVKIVDIHKESAWYGDRKRLIGKTATVAGCLRRGVVRGWKACDFTTEDGEWICCCAVKVEPVE